MKDRIMDPIARAAAQRIAQQAAAVAPSHTSLQCLSEIRDQPVEEFKTAAAVEDPVQPSQPQLTPAVTVALVRGRFVFICVVQVLYFILVLFLFLLGWTHTS